MTQQQEEIVEICQNCCFRDPFGTENLNICRRYAPQRCDSDNESTRPWPIVRNDDWCGEFTPYPKEEK